MLTILRKCSGKDVFKTTNFFTSKVDYKVHVKN
jgi:hypothetical protein